MTEAHEHHTASLALFAEPDPTRFAVAAHSFAEAYSTVTRRGGPAPFEFTAKQAWAALASVRANTILAGLTRSQTVDVIRQYATSGGLGPRLYDPLIGEVAVVHSIRTIVTWNVSHIRTLFRLLEVHTPAVFAK